MDYISHKLSHQPKDIHEPILIDADDPNRSLSWQDYASAVKRIAVGLQTIGLQPLDCVCLLSRNDIYYWVLGDGVAAAGGIICPIASFAKVDEIVRQLQTVSAQWIFVEPDLLPTTTTAAFNAGIPHPLTSSSSTHKSQHQRPSTRASPSPTSSHPTTKPGTLPLKTPPPTNTPLSSSSSSGTTGHAKAVSLSQCALIARFNLHLHHGQHFPPGERTLHYIAQQHASSQSVHHHATTGAARLYLTRRHDPSEIISLIHTHAITRIMVHPQMLEEIPLVLRHTGGGDPRKPLHSLHSVTSGGGIARPQALKNLHSLLPSPEAHVSSAWGATEIGFSPTSSPPSIPAMDGYGYVGLLPPPSVGEIIILHPSTHTPLPPPLTGEICVRGPTLFTHYLSSPSTTASAFITIPARGTFFRTGDAGIYFRHDAGGAGWRLTGTVIRPFSFAWGRRMFVPEEVEAGIFLQMEGVRDVVGHEYGGEEEEWGRGGEGVCSGGRDVGGRGGGVGGGAVGGI